MTTITKRLPVSLLTLRIGIAIVMLVWSVDKLLRPGARSRRFRTFMPCPDWARPCLMHLARCNSRSC
ncbi:MAG: hypothetical protein U5K38_04140 [Woeseiaceae bacterium]|nr:hypothetical protein [Woeseiaceae bacterium]